MNYPMNIIQKRKQDLNQDLYVDMVRRLQTQRPRRIHDNVARLPAPAPQQQEAPTPDGLTAGGAFAILLALLALTAVLILLGAA